MKNKTFKNLLIRTGVVRLSDFAFILAADPKKEKAGIAHTLIYIWDQGKFYDGEATLMQIHAVLFINLNWDV